MNMITLTWLDCLLLFASLVGLLLIPPMRKVTKKAEAEARQARQQDRDEFAALQVRRH